MRLVIECSKPPSLNTLWRHRRTKAGKVAVYLNPTYTRWLRQFGLHWLEQRPRGFKTIVDEVQVTVTAPRSRMDTDNRPKACFDALQKYGILANDNLVRRTISQDGEAPLGCRIVIEAFHA